MFIIRRSRGRSRGKGKESPTSAHVEKPSSVKDASTRWSFARVAAICAVILAATLVAALLFRPGDGHRYSLLFQTAGQLVPGNQVYIGGEPTGSVEEVTLTDDSLAEIEISVEQQLHEGTTAAIRSTSLSGIANRYVSLTPGPNNAPELEEGATVGLTETTTPVDLDQLFNALDRRAQRGLSDFIQGNAKIYVGKGKQASQTFRYAAPSLYQSRRWMEQLNADEELFEQFVVNTSKLVTALSQRQDDLSGSISNARRTFAAIGEQEQALDQTVRELPRTFRQANTTFSNLRDALDDVDPLIETAKPATKNLGPFLRDLRPVVTRSVPIFEDLGLTVNRPGKANDAAEIMRALPKLKGITKTSFASSAEAIDAFQPTLDFARPYMPDVLQSLAKLGQVMGYYDANGHYVRAMPVGQNLFSYNEVTEMLEPIAPSDQFDAFGTFQNTARCPGGATQPSLDSSNPFVGPLWPESGLAPTDCEPGDVPPGP